MGIGENTQIRGGKPTSKFEKFLLLIEEVRNGKQMRWLRVAVVIGLMVAASLASFVNNALALDLNYHGVAGADEAGKSQIEGGIGANNDSVKLGAVGKADSHGNSELRGSAEYTEDKVTVEAHGGANVGPDGSAAPNAGGSVTLRDGEGNSATAGATHDFQSNKTIVEGKVRAENEDGSAYVEGHANSNGDVGIRGGIKW